MARSKKPTSRPAAAPRRRLSRDRILRSALRIADREGVAALSMRRLGQALGCEAMSLYNHVANKDDVLDGIVDLVIGEMEPPTPDAPDWRRAMHRRAHSAHEVLLRHPWSAALIVSRVNAGPHNLAYVDATLGCLLGAGFSFELADRAWNAIDSHVHGFTLLELNFPFEPDAYATAAAAYLPSLPAERYPHLHALTVEVAEGRHRGIHDFDFGLELILDGLERLLAAR